MDWFEHRHDIEEWSHSYKPTPISYEWDQLNERVAVPILKSGDFVWHPPLAIADMAIEQLRKARLKR